jgi:hypothetical protein
MDAAIYGVALAFPGSAQTPGLVVQLKYGAVVTVHPGVTTGGKPGNAGADYDDRFINHY